MWDGVKEFLEKVLITFVAGIYHIINYVYQIFLYIGYANILSNDTFKETANRIYILLSVVVLFIVVYSLLQLVVDPNKGKDISKKYLSKFVSTFVLIVLCPTLFGWAEQFQNVVLSGNYIGKLFNGNMSAETSASSVRDGGIKMSATTFNSFIVPSMYAGEESSIKNLTEIDGLKYTFQDGSGELDCTNTKNDNCTLELAKKYALETGNFDSYKAFAKNIVKDQVDFNFFVSLIAGGFLLYCMIVYVLQLATRVFKMAFYELIAPLCIAFRIMPGQEKKFTDWFKAVKNTYLEIFIRVAIMSIGIYFINIVSSTNTLNSLFSIDTSALIFVIPILILGAALFIKEAPKLIEDIFGLGNAKLGLKDFKDSLSKSGFFAAGAAVGGAVTGAVRNGIAFRKEHENDEVKARGGFRTVMGGFAGGAVNGFKSGNGAKSFSDMKKAAGKGAAISSANRANRIAMSQRGNGSLIKGWYSDKKAAFEDWKTGGADQYSSQIKHFSSLAGSFDKVRDAAGKIKSKFGNTAELAQGFDESIFKGSDSQKQKYLDLYNNYVNQGLSYDAMKADVERMANSDVNRNDFYATDGSGFDSDGYERACAEHAQRVADSQSMLNQLDKAIDFRIIDKAIEYNNATTEKEIASIETVGGITPDKYEDVKASIKEFITGIELDGEDKFKVNSAKAMDDMATVYKAKAAKASQDSAHARQLADARKGDK